MSAVESGPEPGERHYPCPWCERPEVWPDRCAEELSIPGESAFRCASTIEKQCMRGDHRRCEIGACTVSTRWHDEVRDAGTAAAQTAGHAWAVVSTIPGAVVVSGTAEDREQAERLWRWVLYNAGRTEDVDPESRGLVYIVRSADGGLL